MVEFSSIYCFRPDHWNYATPSEKQDALAEVERQCALEQNRAERTIEYESLPNHRHGYYDKNNPDVIVVRQQDLGLESPHEVVDTVAHEGRHAYQHDSVSDPASHPEVSDHQRSHWSYGLSCPVIPDPGSEYYADDYEVYRNQPHEKDARQYAAGVVAQLPPVEAYETTTGIESERQALATEGLDVMPPDSTSKISPAGETPKNVDPGTVDATSHPALSAERQTMLEAGVAAMPPPPPPPPPSPAANESESVSMHS